MKKTMRGIVKEEKRSKNKRKKSACVPFKRNSVEKKKRAGRKKIIDEELFKYVIITRCQRNVCGQVEVCLEAGNPFFPSKSYTFFPYVNIAS